MMRQLSKTTSSQYQPRYSPRSSQFLTVTLLACHSASLVSSTEFSMMESSTYWKEYLPVKLHLLICTLLPSKKKYEPSSSQPSRITPRLLQPNSSEEMLQVEKCAFSHSRKAFGPIIRHTRASMPSQYHIGARQVFSSSQSAMRSSRVCQKG